MKRISEKGFTLIELLVVVAIIGMLSSVVLSSMNSARKKARDARRISDVKSLQTALELYYAENVAYPTSAALALTGTSLAGLVPNYIAKLPVDPAASGTACAATDRTYCYGSAAPLNGYTITIFLEKTGARCRVAEGADTLGGTLPICAL